jgi:hypothetical protein
MVFDRDTAPDDYQERVLAALDGRAALPLRPADEAPHEGQGEADDGGLTFVNAR